MIDKINQGDYIPHYSLQDLKVQIIIVQLKDDSQILRDLLDEEFRNNKNQKLDLIVSCQLVINEKPIEPAQIYPLGVKILLDKKILLPYKYKNLPYNSLIAITLWSSFKTRQENKPLGGTVVSLFDEEFKLREGKYHLHIWPNSLPDIRYNSTTPGLVTDQHINDINFLTQKEDFLNLNEQNQNIKSILGVKRLYIFQKVPAGFLEVEFPKIIDNPDVHVFFEDNEYLDQNQIRIQNQLEQNQSITKFINQPKQLFINSNNFSDCIVASDFDYEFNREDPTEELFCSISKKDDFTNPITLKPNNEQNQILNKLIKMPILGQMKPNEKLLFYRFRYSLKDNKEAFVQFLNAIDWHSETQIQEAMNLLVEWTPIDYSDALHLLSSNYCANDIYTRKTKVTKPQGYILEVRKYAVKILQKVNLKQISDILLQLVQALRYEFYDDEISSLANFLIDISCRDIEICTMMYWFLTVEAETERRDNKEVTSEQLKVNEWFQIVLNKLKKEVATRNPDNFNMIESQKEFRTKLKLLSRDLSKFKDRKDRIEEMKDLLNSSEWKGANLPNHKLCLDTNIEIYEAIGKEANIFKSAMAPMKMTFLGKENDQERKIEIIFKNGDDLRQDQLVIQIFTLMDQCLKQVNQDLKLTKYKVLACSKNDGFMEFVPHTRTLQDIFGEYKNDFKKYLRNLSEDPSNPVYDNIKKEYMQQNNCTKIDENEMKQLIKQQLSQEDEEKGINKVILDNYILSLAGYSVLTYFLGIGDRHLENLMIERTGKLMHIDFGFILGKDPKPYPPPIKLCKEMVDGMCGVVNQNKFYSKCVDIYKYLRKYAKLIINLLQLMIDSGIPDITQDAIEKMAEKFCLNENDEAAERHFLTILNESVTALFAKITDITHKWATYFRK